MAFKLYVLAAVLAMANVGYLGGYGYAVAPAIGASHQSIVRSLDGNSAVSTYSKAVDSVFSSVRKYDTRISNDAVALAHAPVAAYAAAPAVTHLSFTGFGAAYG